MLRCEDNQFDADIASVNKALSIGDITFSEDSFNKDCEIQEVLFQIETMRRN